MLLVLLGAWWLGPRSSPTLLKMLVFPIAGAVVLARPDLGIIGLVLAAALVPLEIGTGTQTTINIAVFGVAGLTAVWVLRMILQRRLALVPSVANRPWMALCVVAGFSIVAGAATWNPWVVTKNTFIVVQMAQWAVFVLAACAYWLGGNFAPDRRTLRWVVAIVLVLSAIELAGSLVPPFGRVVGRVSMDGPIVRVWAVSLTLALALHRRDLGRPVRFALASLALALVLGPFVTARAWASGWMPGAIAIAGVILIWLWNERRQVALVAVSVSAVLGLAVVAVGASRMDRWSLDTRFIAWAGLTELLQGHWLFGLGLASYWHYWRGVIGTMSYLDPETGYLHYTVNPTVNMHNNYMDVLGQMGIIGVVVLVWLIAALYLQAARTFWAERDGFGRAFATASFGAFTGMLFAGMLGDWFFPFVYNIGLRGFRDAFIGWLLLGGLVLLDASRGSTVVAESAPAGITD